MSDEFGPSFITLTDEDGNDIELEYVDALEHEGQTYMAFFPAVEDEADEESEDYGLVILKSVTENGEELLSTLRSEENSSVPWWRILSRHSRCAVPETLRPETRMSLRPEASASSPSPRSALTTGRVKRSMDILSASGASVMRE